MTTALCQPAVALKEDEGLGAVFWFVLVVVLIILGALFFIICRYYAIPWYKSRNARPLPLLPVYHPWRPSTLKLQEITPAPIGTEGTLRRETVLPTYSIPKNIPVPLPRTALPQPRVTFSPLPPPVVIIPPDVDLPITPTPMADLTATNYRHYAELSPPQNTAIQRFYQTDVAQPPTYTLVSSPGEEGANAYEAIAVRTTTTTRRTTVLSPIPPSRVTTIV